MKCDNYMLPTLSYLSTSKSFAFNFVALIKFLRALNFIKSETYANSSPQHHFVFKVSIFIWKCHEKAHNTQTKPTLMISKI